jgi:hypothetical protein
LKQHALYDLKLPWQQNAMKSSWEIRHIIMELVCQHRGDCPYHHWLRWHIYTLYSYHEYSLGCPHMYHLSNTGWNLINSGLLSSLDISAMEPQSCSGRFGMTQGHPSGADALLIKKLDMLEMNEPLFDLIMSQMNPVHILTFYIAKESILESTAIRTSFSRTLLRCLGSEQVTRCQPIQTVLCTC